MKKEYKVFVINPGSTSTKVALFAGEQKLWQKNVDHDVDELAKCAEIPSQLPLRLQTIQDAIKEAGIDLTGVDAIATRCGGLVGLKGGVYNVNDQLYEHAKACFTVRHPNTLGPQIARALQEQYGGQTFAVNPPDVDELDEVERVSGFHELFREAKGHPLNQKENCIRYAKAQGKTYEEMNLICCHIGGGVSIGAHRHGKLCCVNDAVNGDGPMAPTRAGWVPATGLIDLCYSGKYTQKEMYNRVVKAGGLADHLGTSDTREITARIAGGDKYAKLIYDAFIYQIAKAVGGCAAALKGQVDGIILTGGVAHDDYLCQELESYIGWIAPISRQAGEFEMEALAAGAIRGMEGEEEIREYTGIPVFNGFDYLKA